MSEFTLFVEQKSNFNKNETGSKMENATHAEKPCAPIHIRIKNQKRKCDDLELRKERIFSKVYFAVRNFL